MDEKAIEQYYINQATRCGAGVFHGMYYERGYGVQRRYQRWIWHWKFSLRVFFKWLCL